MSSGKVGLHNHADTSCLDGLAFPEEMAARAGEVGDEAIALTDHDDVGGQYLFQKACQAAGIKAILGIEARFLRDIAASREAKTRGLDASHICLLAADNTGLSNMWALSSLAYEPGNFYGKPQLTPALMREYSGGLWASDGCGMTRFCRYVNEDKLDEARQEWGILRDIFGERFYSELHTFQLLEPANDDDRRLNAEIMRMNQVKVQFAKEMGVPLVVVNDAHYAQREQWREHRLTWDMNTKWKGDQTKSKGQAADWIMDRDEILHFMGAQGIATSVIEEAMANSVWIAENCNAEIKPGLAMPRLYPTDAEDIDVFERDCLRGYERMVLDKGLPEETYGPRLEREMRLIIDKGMAGYFNVVADYVGKARDGSYIQWVIPGAAKKPCLCGPGRGSGGGSLVNWLLGITSLDPIRYDLMFERFINPDRPDFPDIDVDFQKSHRLDVKRYLGARYGDDKVCAIGTRSRSGPKATVKDLAKIMGIPFKDSLAITKLIGKVDFSGEEFDESELDEDREPPTWAEVLDEIGGDLAPYVKAHPKLFDTAQKMIRRTRQNGVHAAGVLVNGDQALLGVIPFRRKGGNPNEPIATQFDMNEIAELGGVKDDLLSNKGLDVLAIARGLIHERHGVWIDYDGFGYGVPEGAKVITLGEEHFAEPAIWEQIDRGQTGGIFQIHTAGGTKQAVRFRPRSLPELADLISINRPGVIRAGLLETYLRRRRGEEPIKYDHPMMEPITGRTMGILVYQEDLIRTAREIAGFSAGDAEKLRKAIGKKLMDVMLSLEEQFVSGCVANEEFVRQGGNERVALKIWASLLASGAYAFNRAHATGYAMQSVGEIWTKHHYFDEFITGCLAVHPSSKTLRFLRECRQRGRPVLPPDVNKSGDRFTLADDGIRYGLTDIRGIGDAVIPEIMSLRPFADVSDYLNRTTKNGGHKKNTVDALVKIGALDTLGARPDEGFATTRSRILDEVYYHRAGLEVAPKKWSNLSTDERNQIVADKWAAKPAEYLRYDFADEKVLFEIEKELVGTFVTVDPMAKYVSMIQGVCIQHPNDMDDFEPGDTYVIGGELVRATRHQQRNGHQMAFLTVAWNEESFEFMAFAEAWANCKVFLKEGAPVACEVVALKGGGAHLAHVERLDYVAN